MIEDNLKVEGIVELELFGSDHILKHSETVNNLVTTAGKNFIVRRIKGDVEVIKSISIGSGTTPATLTDTVMGTLLAENDVLFTFVDTVNTNVLVNTTTFEEGIGTGTVNEIGLFSDSSPRKLLCRTVVSTPFVKSPTDYLNVSWKIKIG
jgi:hypothetical protein